MLNQIVLVGRIVNKIEKKDNKATMTIAIPRSFKNAEGEYETDFVDVKIFDNTADTINNFCKKGDIVGVKGRLQTHTIEKYHTKMNILEVIAEKVTYLSNGNNNR